MEDDTDCDHFLSIWWSRFGEDPDDGWTGKEKNNNNDDDDDDDEDNMVEN